MKRHPIYIYIYMRWISGGGRVWRGSKRAEKGLIIVRLKVIFVRYTLLCALCWPKES